MAADDRWMALESSPEVLTTLVHKLLSSPSPSSPYAVSDIWSLDDDALQFMTPGVAGVILLFPSEKGTPPQEVPPHPALEGSFYLRQDVGTLANACGTIAVIHALANGKGIDIPEGSVLGRYVAATRCMDATARGAALDANEEVHDVHKSLVVQGQSRVLESASVCHHFVAFVERNGCVVELDGYYNRGPKVVREMGKGETLLKAAAAVIKENYIAPKNGNIDFSVLAIAPEA